MKEVNVKVLAPKPLTFELLRRLSDGKFHSGELLAKDLGVSRASVNNALHGVDQLGLTLYSVRGRGYCLPNAPQWLDVEQIYASLVDQKKTFGIEVLDDAVSSNSVLLHRATLGEPSGSVIAVEWQSGGRGRLGRAWHSGLGNALTFSVLWRFECGLAGLSGLSLATGIALMRAYTELGIEGAQLKWPNDIVSNKGKIAGILIEAQGDMLGPSAVVIGIGINLSLPKNIVQRIDQPVSDLASLANAVPSRNLLLATVLNKLSDILREFQDAGFVALREEWERLHYYHNKSVQLLLPDGKMVQGIVRGVNQDGALMVELASVSGSSVEIKAFHAGEISLRSQHENVVV
jgi:BirA family biotin operon repressor/biotin-[acetyl-CoA-carboxylase] ligase